MGIVVPHQREMAHWMDLKRWRDVHVFPVQSVPAACANKAAPSHGAWHKQPASKQGKTSDELNLALHVPLEAMCSAWYGL